MHLCTHVDLKKPDFEIDVVDGFVSLGSCFADKIGQYLISLKIPTGSNTFGTIFNVHSLHQILLQKEPREAYLERDELWFHYDYHTEIHAKSKELLKECILNKRAALLEAIKASKSIIFTLGTSWVYKQYLDGQIVANCHKQPGENFEKTLLGLEEQKHLLGQIHAFIKSVNPAIKIIFTVSPVRHIKDGLVENNISKAILLLLCQDATENLTDCYYFESYEIMIDELRDYRFYEKDLIHPNKIASDYIIEKFEQTYFSPALKILNTKKRQILVAENHKPLNPNSQNHLKFLEDLAKKKKEIGFE